MLTMSDKGASLLRISTSAVSFTPSHLDPLLPSCSIPLYAPEDLGSNILELTFLFGYLVTLLPDTCSCAIRPRLFSTCTETTSLLQG